MAIRLEPLEGDPPAVLDVDGTGTVRDDHGDHAMPDKEPRIWLVE